MLYSAHGVVPMVSGLRPQLMRLAMLDMNVSWIITDKLDEIDLFDGDIGAVVNNHVPISQYYNRYADKIRRIAKQEGWTCTDNVPYFNSGVLYVKDTEKARHFCSDWH